MNKTLFAELAAEQKKFLITTCTPEQKLTETIISQYYFDNIILQYQLESPEIYSQLVTARDEILAILNDNLYKGNNKIEYLINKLAVSSIQKIESAVTNIKYGDWYITRAMTSLKIAEKLNERYPTPSFEKISKNSYSIACRLCGPEIKDYLFFADTVADIFMKTINLEKDDDCTMTMH